MKVFILFLFTLFSLNLYAARIEVSDDVQKIEASVDGLDLRAKNRIGFGMSFLGATGTAGVNMEINFHPRWGINAGIGTNSDFQSFFLEYKRILAGESFVPYGVLGFARWQGDSNSSIQSTSPGYLAEDFMSTKDRREGKVDENLLYPGVGIQYLQLDGEWKGFSIYTQLSLMFDVLDLKVAPTIGFGSTYYF